LGKKAQLEVGGSLWLVSGGKNGAAAGHGRMALLRAIDAHGSISAAAREMGMSYKAAWDAIDAINNLSGSPLVVRETGGKGGGGTRLTPHGKRLVESFALIDTAHQRFLHDVTVALSDSGDTLNLLRRLAMKTSARNQFYGKVAVLRRGAVNDEVDLELPGGDRIVAIITHESTAELGLAVGSDAVAMVKASWVLLATGESAQKLSARNQLRGTVCKIVRGAVNAEVAVELSGGTVVTAIVTNGSIDSLELEIGRPVVAIFKASSVIIGVAS
jgi:molybdate transport system regulatory protein